MDDVERQDKKGSEIEFLGSDEQGVVIQFGPTDRVTKDGRSYLFVCNGAILNLGGKKFALTAYAVEVTEGRKKADPKEVASLAVAEALKALGLSAEAVASLAAQRSAAAAQQESPITARVGARRRVGK